MIRRYFTRRRQREARQRAARLGMAAYVKLNPILIRLHMREAASRIRRTA